MDSWLPKTDISSAVRAPRWWIVNRAIDFVIVDLLRSQVVLRVSACSRFSPIRMRGLRC